MNAEKERRTKLQEERLKEGRAISSSRLSVVLCRSLAVLYRTSVSESAGVGGCTPVA